MHNCTQTKQRKQNTIKRSILIVFLLFAACARAPIKSLDQAMRKVPSVAIADDMNFENLKEAIEKNILQLKSFNPPIQAMRFGPVIINKDIYIAALKSLSEAIGVDPSGQLFLSEIKNNFEFYEVYGGDRWGEILLTSYYEPILRGSLRKTKEFSEPLYANPADLILVDMVEYAQVFPEMKDYQEKVIREKSRDGFLRGRLAEANGVQKIIPYYTREDISVKNVLQKQTKIIAWVDPVDAFFLQIQGSGRIQLSAQSDFVVGYAGQNGHPYNPIGKYLFDKIPKDKMTAAKIANHLHTLPLDEQKKLMSLNPSFVFFQKLKGEPLTYMGTEVIAGRTLASDQKYFPKGALAFLDYSRPVAQNIEDDPVFTPSSRFVLDQDVGGGIRGPGRADLFWGSGPEAAAVSGVMRQKAHLYYLVPKVSLNALRN